MRIERLECVPPPTVTRAVSPCTSRTVSIGTSSSSAATCANVVSWPCPLDCVPVAISTTRSAADAHGRAARAAHRPALRRSSQSRCRAACRLRAGAARRVSKPAQSASASARSMLPGSRRNRTSVRPRCDTAAARVRIRLRRRISTRSSPSRAGGNVEQPFERERRFGAAGAAERRGRRRVGQRAARRARARAERRRRRSRCGRRFAAAHSRPCTRRRCRSSSARSASMRPRASNASATRSTMSRP